MRPIRVAATVAMVDDEVGDVVPGDDRVGVGEVVPFLEVIVSQLAEGIPGEALLPRIEVDIGDQRTDEVAAVPKDGSVEVSVSDTGVGIAPEDQEAVFEEFRQVGTAERKAEGTGLGLTLCRKFIELHGGRISVTSQVDVGSTFAFTIPVRRDE